MKSKTSFFNMVGGWFNRTLYLKNLSRWWPLWGMASLGGALFPLGLILAFLRHRETLTRLEFASYLYEVVAYAVPTVMLCYCVLCAMAVWGYLYNAKSVGLMHTLPIRREGLFLTNFLSGMTMVVIPCAVTGLFTLLLALVAHGFDGKAFLVTILAVAGEGFFYFSAATAVAFITGHAAALPVLYFIFQFLAPMLDFLFSVAVSYMVFGLRQNIYSGLVEWLSPTVYLMNNVTNRRLYDIPFPDGGLMRDYQDHWIGVALDNGWLIGVYALTGLFWLLVAWLLYRNHRSESAGDVISVNWLKPVFQASVTGVCALGGGQFLYMLLVEGFDMDSGSGYSLLPLILCMTFAGAIGYYAAAMLLEKSLRVFRKKSLTGIAVTLACCTVFCSLMYFDAFGVMGRIPTNEEIKYVHFYVADNNYYLYPGEDDALIEEIRNLQRAIIDDRAYIQTAPSVGIPALEADADDGDNSDHVALVNINLDYILKNGREVNRYYPLYLTRERMETEGTYDNLLDALVNSAAMRQKRLHVRDRNFRPVSGNLSVNRTRMDYDLSSRELAQLLDALGQDAEDGTWGSYLWFESRWTNSYAVYLNMDFEAINSDAVGGRNWDYTTVYLRPGMEHTISALKEMGYITDADLVTEAEVDALRQAEDPWEYEKYKDRVDRELEEAITEDGMAMLVKPEAETETEQVPAEPTPDTTLIVPEPAHPVPGGAGDPNPNSYTPPTVSSSLTGSNG